MKFENAVKMLKRNNKYYMRLSSSEDIKIKIQYPDEKSMMTRPYFYVESGNGIVPWIPTMEDLFSEWECSF